MMNKYLYLILFFPVLINGCAKHNPIDFSSSNAFFSSLNEKEIIKKESKNNTSAKKTLKINDIKKTKKQISKKVFQLTLLSYEKQLKEKIGLDEFTILKIFNEPNLIIKHGKVKNLQFHFQSCYLDLFFLNEDEIYSFKYFDIRSSSISSRINKQKCAKELNNKFTLIRDPR